MTSLSLRSTENIQIENLACTVSVYQALFSERPWREQHTPCKGAGFEARMRVVEMF